MSGHPEHYATSPQPVVSLTHIVCGIDGSEEAIEAVREAAALAPAAGGSLMLVAAVMPGFSDGLATVVPGTPAPDPEQHARLEAARRLERARETVGDRLTTVALVRSGRPAAVLQADARRLQADGIAVGSHGNGRVSGVLLGSVATRVIHGAECSVLVARADPNRPFPGSIAVGVDGSDCSRRALAAAEALAERLGVPMRALHVAGCHDTPSLPDDLEVEVEEIHQHVAPADALCARVTEVDLLVVGSRGLRGMRALGSVSETVAHRSRASVLIVR